MRAFLDPRQTKHNPQSFLVLGQQRVSPEQPERITRLKAGAEAAGCVFEAPEDAGIAQIAAIHTSEYLSFLQTIHGRWQALDGASDEVIPNIHARARTDSYPTSPVGQAGYHQADTACPIGAHTWDAAYWSAQSAIGGARALGEEECAYVLSRPPGHHAYHDQAGGFCFLNNAAIAAQDLQEQGARVAILDVDVHHGNGTQGIFETRSDVLTVSIHADPDAFYPFYWGHAHERGIGDGLGANLNIPLPRGTQDDAYLEALAHALQRIQGFGCDAVVVALGLDTSIDDPFQGFAVTDQGFARIGAAIAAMGLPTLYVQEGGYMSDALGPNLTQVLIAAQG
ncbi:MAG: histone deacetylase family protein [Pelagimonas sp.]|uniref:histone deacetylase family protein n=1 Tax=Pelagimonas sp. TaxID=2073170 RepID=UPI003D6B70EF